MLIIKKRNVRTSIDSPMSTPKEKLGHSARPVIQKPFSESDPFILLMDDMLDKQDEEPAGGPHPHAGFETVSLLFEGGVMVGEEQDILLQEQGGLLDHPTDDGTSKLKLTAGDSGARFVLYSGQPPGESIESKGPFIGDTQEDIKRLYKEYREGKMQHISTVSAKQRITW